MQKVQILSKAFLLSTVILMASCSFFNKANNSADSKPYDPYGLKDLSNYLDTVRDLKKNTLLNTNRDLFFLWKLDTGACLKLRDMSRLINLGDSLKNYISIKEALILLGKPNYSYKDRGYIYYQYNAGVRCGDKRNVDANAELGFDEGSGLLQSIEYNIVD